MAVSVETLRHAPFFQDLKTDALAPLAAVTEEVRFEAGAALFREGEMSKALYVMLEGAVEIRRAVDAERTQTLAVIEAGDLVGEMGLFTEEPRSATAVAVEPSCGLVISRAAFDTLLQSNSDSAAALFYQMTRTFGERLRQTDAELVAVSELARILSRAASLPELLSGALAQAVKSCGASAGLVALWNRFTEEYETAQVLGNLPADGHWRTTDMLIQELSGQDRFLTAAPITRETRVIGSLVLVEARHGGQASGKPFTRSQRAFCESLGGLLAPAVEACWMREEEASRTRLARARAL